MRLLEQWRDRRRQRKAEELERLERLEAERDLRRARFATRLVRGIYSTDLPNRAAISRGPPEPT